MQKIDMKEELSQLYHASAKEFVQVDVSALRFLTIDGQGDPNTSPAYAQDQRFGACMSSSRQGRF